MKTRRINENLINEYINNKGSAVLTVIVIFMFLSILVAILMPLTVINYRIKAVERQTKNEFYYVEKSLNEIYAGVGKECSLELGNVYSDTLASAYSFTDENLAYQKFCEDYVKTLYYKFCSDGSETVNIQDKLNGYLTNESKNRAIVSNVSEIVFHDKNNVEIASISSGNYAECRKIVIKNVCVSTKDSNGYVSSITTDIEIQIPTINFFRVNENELDYALVACKGIDVKGIMNVTGNIYAGIDKNENDATIANPNYCKGGINIIEEGKATFNSDYVISAGDIVINSKSGQTKILGNNTNDNEVWFENILVGKKDSTNKESDIEIGGNAYALNDLQIEGKGHSVKISGNYYGYGDGGESTSLDSKEATLKPIIKDDSGNDTYYDDITRTKSASIIVNAKDSTVDLTELKNAVLLGQAYIDRNSKSSISKATSVADESKLSEDGSGLAGTMKASQEILLVPEEFLDSTNPVKVIDVSKSKDLDFAVDNGELNAWISNKFGYIEDGANKCNVKLKSTPTRTVRFSKSDGVYSYCYLQFNDSESQNNYIDGILNVDSESENIPKLHTIKERIIASASAQNSSIKVGSDTNVFAVNGGIVAYGTDDANTISIKNNKSDLAGYTSSVNHMFNKYKDLQTYLDFTSDYSKSVANDDYNNPDLPFGRLWWKKSIDNLSSATSTDIGGCRVVVNGNKTMNLSNALKVFPSDYTENENETPYFKAIIISDGDIIVNESANVKGFIFCNGKLTIEEGKTLNIISDLSVVQNRISKEVEEVKNNIAEGKDNPYEDGYLIKYLLRTDYDTTSVKSLKRYYDIDDILGKRRYNISVGNTSEVNNPVNSDYTSFITLTNWRKTGAAVF